MNNEAPAADDIRLDTTEQLRPVYVAILKYVKTGRADPVAARRAIVALSGYEIVDLAALIERTTGEPTSRQLVGAIINGSGRSHRVERELCRMFDVYRIAMFPEPRGRGPNRTRTRTSEDENAAEHIHNPGPSGEGASRGTDTGTGPETDGHGPTPARDAGDPAGNTETIRDT